MCCSLNHGPWLSSQESLGPGPPTYEIALGVQGFEGAGAVLLSPSLEDFSLPVALHSLPLPLVREPSLPVFPFFDSSQPQFSKSPMLQFLVMVCMTPAELIA